MFTQLSLFDLPGLFDSASPVVSLDQPESSSQAVAVTAKPAAAAEPTAAAVSPVQLYGDRERGDSIQPMGDLARLVIARYEMVARRREEMMRRKAEQPRRSIRVLSPS